MAGSRGGALGVRRRVLVSRNMHARMREDTESSQALLDEVD